MRVSSLCLFMSAVAALALRADARPEYSEVNGGLVSVSVEVDGAQAALFPAPDGSGRFYVEARRGARYAVRIENRSSQRLGVLLAVDGLNAISGEIEASVVGASGARPGRMYVLDPWADVSVRGWRASLDEVRAFTFVDEQRSYAARSDKANRKMGWIEVRAYRERRAAHIWRQPLGPADRGGLEGEQDESMRDTSEAPASAAPPAAKAAPAPESRARAEGAGTLGGRSESYPGTGWGAREHDPVRVVSFEPEAYPADSLTLRYEYRRALVRLGVLPRWPTRDRLRERDAAQDGFARPPVR